MICVSVVLLCKIISPDKSGYQENIFLISAQKHMLWVLIRSASREIKMSPALIGQSDP